MKLIIDTDPGIDDAIALFYAAGAPDIDILGLTTVFGNVTVDQATRNALYLAEVAELDIPVAKGAAKPQQLPSFPPTSRIHDDEGLGGVEIKTPLKRPSDKTADEYLVEMAYEYKDELTICALGPLTNIAAAMRRDPQFGRNCAQIVLMGGSLDAGGNITDHAEANIYHDPHAAAEVFASGANITMVGLDVTNKVQFSASDFSNVAWNAPKLGSMLQEMSYHYIKFYQTVGKFDGCSMHDPTALVACTHPDVFKMQKTAVEVTCSGKAIGRTTARSFTNQPSVTVAIKPDIARVKELIHNTLARLP